MTASNAGKPRLWAAVVAMSLGLMPSIPAAEAKPEPKESPAPRLPTDFRREMVHLGSWFVPSGGAAGFHDVYASPEAVESFRATGAWPDGATLVKELRGSVAGDYTTGAGVQRATIEVLQTFVMVKDADGSERGPLWGEGWGWALYKPDRPGVNVATNYETDCLGCHIPAKAQDYVYVQAYPTLSRP
ncbi:MAG: cytochrome P460 family protein [Myxococcota bacterium]